MKRLLYAFVIGLGFSGSLAAQQLPISNLYDNNRMIFNPANTGQHDGPTAILHHRQQWMGVQGAPMNQVLTLQSPIGEYVGVGGMIQNTKTNIFRQTSVHLNYAYGVDVALGHRINFGLGAVYYQNALDLSNLVVQDPTELSFYSSNFNGSSFNFDFGIRYNWDKLEVGLSANQLLNNRLNDFNPDGNRFNQFRTHFNGIASYGFDIESVNMIIKPTVLVRYIPQSGTFNDYLVSIDWKNLVWGNIGYRDGYNYIFSAGTWLTNNVSLTYSYNYSSELLSLESFGTHELQVKINLKPRDGDGPFKTNVRTGELTEREQALLEKRQSDKTVIIIKGKGYDAGNEEIVIKPGQKMGEGGELEQLKIEMFEINKKIDALLKKDLTNKDERATAEEEILKLRMRLMELLDKNNPDNVQEISDEVGSIQKKIEVLKQKIQ